MTVNTRFVVIRLAQDPTGKEFCQVALVGFDDECASSDDADAYRFVFGRHPGMGLPTITYETFMLLGEDLIPPEFKERLEAEFRVGDKNYSQRNVDQVRSWLSFVLTPQQLAERISATAEFG